MNLQACEKITAVFLWHMGVGIIQCEQKDGANLRTLKTQPFMLIRNMYLLRIRVPPSRWHPSSEQ